MKTHVIHWWFNDRDVLKLTDIELFHIYMNKKYSNIFDTTIFSIAINDINNIKIKEFIKNELYHFFGENIEVSFIQNNKEYGEFITFNEHVIKSINSKNYVFYSHFKGVSKPDYDINELYWSYLMYYACLSNVNYVYNSFENEKLVFCLNNDVDVKLKKDVYRIFNKLYLGHLSKYLCKKNTLDNVIFPNGSFCWYNMSGIHDKLSSLTKSCDININIDNIDRKRFICEYGFSMLFDKQYYDTLPYFKRFDFASLSEGDTFHNCYKNKWFCERLREFDEIEQIYVNNLHNTQNTYKCAVVAIARLENDYINEWCKHHIKLGFEHIYIYDNSYDNEKHIDKVIDGSIKNYVTCIPAFNEESYQFKAYNDSYKKFSHLYDYMLYVDIDEFLILNKHNTISEYILFLKKSQDDFEAVRINWKIFDDNNSISRDINESVVSFFKQEANTALSKKHNQATKSLIKCGIENLYFDSSHFARKNNGHHLITINSSGNILKNIKKPEQFVVPEYTYAQINHYATKTISEYMYQKLRRGDAGGYITRTIDNRFFCYCKKTQEKMNFYEKYKNNITDFFKNKNIKKDKITYFYSKCNRDKNAGDKCTEYILQKIYSGTKLEFVKENPNIVLCGSVLDDLAISNADYILGAGIHCDNVFSNKNKKSYLAVRGKLSRQRLVDFNIIEKDEINDINLIEPGLIVSKIFNNQKINQHYKIGIICHYVDYDCFKRYNNTNHIVINMGSENIDEILNKINSCDIILSSSLHGIVFSHSLGKPAYHIVNNRIKDSNTNKFFKFKDYYSLFDSIEYKNFTCSNNIIPIDEILKYDMHNRSISNPTTEQVSNIQERFIKLLPYKENMNFNFNFKNDKKIFVTLTSWKKRINFVHETIKSLLNNTTKPDVIYLNLSSDEFKNMYDELPEELLELYNTKQIIINWVEEDTKVFKKVLPILQYLNDDDIIIQVDDDIVYPENIIETLLSDFETYKCPITTNEHLHTSLLSGKKIYFTCGALSLSQKKNYDGWEKFVNEDVIKTHEDDRVYPIILEMNGYFYKPSNTISFKNILKLQKKNYYGNEIIPIRDSRKTKDILTRRIKEVGYGYAKNTENIVHDTTTPPKKNKYVLIGNRLIRVK